MDRPQLKAYFTESSPLDWVCPTCRKSVLRIKPETFQKVETRSSREAHDHEAWDPDWIRYSYICLLECSNDSCKEIVANVGRGVVDYDVKFDRDGEPDYIFADFFRPLFFDPPLTLFKIPAECPESVGTELKNSFAQFFASPSAALNFARSAIEALVTHLGVKRFQVQGGNRRPISLHIRITLLPAQYANVKELLLAIKWLGNAGSHPGAEISADDVLDAYELIEHVLAELFDGKSKAMKALARKVNKRKGPKG
ncbi:MAG TPA: DUF4145 domain-containing protein [Holophagaceae bacterium]|nr:DUF4145 domain-containing protein [Holophagaceae bacterium]